jgi:hypothetical protein
MAANPEMPTPKPSFMYILSNSGELEQLNLIKRKKEGNSNIVTTTSTFAEYFKLSNNGLELQHLLKNSEQNVKFVRGS